MRKRSRLTALALVAVCASLVVLAAPGSAPGQGKGFDELPLVEGLQVSAAMQIFGSPNPVGGAAIRVWVAKYENSGPLLGSEWELVPDKPYPLSEDALDSLKDGTKIAPASKPPDQWNADEKAFAAVRFDALVKSRLAYRLAPEIFEQAAQEYSYVTYDHLFNTPKQFRGKVVPITGRMIRLRQFDTPKDAQDKDIDVVYEAWIVGSTPKRPPYWVMFTNLPKGLSPAETMDRPVRFYGYFIKKVSYRAEKAYMDTPFLIGPTVYLEPPPVVEERSPYTKDILIAVLGGLLAIGMAIAFMTLWFRRGDRKIHQRLANLRNQPLNLGDEEPAAPVPPRSEPQA